MTKGFLLGCHGRGAQHIPGQPISVDEKFRLVDLSAYGDGARYSLFEHNAAMAHWIRKTWDELKAPKQ